MSSFRGAFAIIMQTARQIGQPLPPELATDLAEIDRLAGIIGTYAPQSVAAAVLAAHAAGKDPASDRTVLAAIASQALISPAVIQPTIALLDERRREALIKHFPELLAGWRVALDGVSTAVSAARQSLPDMSFIDPGALSNVPSAHATQWCQARDALTLAGQVVTAWSMLTTATRMLGNEGSDRRWKPLILADLTAAELDAFPLGHATAPANSGHPFALATPDEFRERIDRVLGQRQDAATAAAKAQHLSDTQYLRMG
jgi:hypothetical protein